MIKVAYLMEYAILFVFCWFVIFQIIVPWLTDTPFFPLLRHKRAQAIAELAEATEEREIDAIKAAATGLSVGQNRKSATKGSK